VYAVIAREFLPPGMVGLVLAGMFAATMSMTASDSNAVSAVITRDMLPVIFRGLRNISEQRGLLLGRVTTFLFTALTLLVAINAETFGGIIGLVVVWFAGLLGPTAIPMILGLLPAFRHSGATAAVVSTLAGVATFAVATFVFQGPFVASTGLPVVVSAVLFVGFGLLNRHKPVAPEVDGLLESLNEDRAEPEPSPVTTARGMERGS
jgi:SSS family solute:Na+ symporter